GDPKIISAAVSNRIERRAGDGWLLLPGSAGVLRVNDSPLLAGYQHVVASAGRHCKEVCSESAFHIFPGGAAVVGAQNNSARAHRVTAQPVGKRQGVEPLPQILIDAFPGLARVFSAQDSAVG